MKLIWREVAGWLLVVVGLALAVTFLGFLARSQTVLQYLGTAGVGIVALTVLLGGSRLLGALTLELAGWLLVLAGLAVLYQCYALIEDSRVFEAAPLTIVGIIVFRGGIHLLKVAVAARICLLAKERTGQDTARPPARGTPSGRGSAPTTAAARGS